MPFLFSAPVMAWLLPAVSLPILFHLFFRLRRQVREFPSLMFFLRIDPRLSAKRKIHEWLILFLRCLFLLLLILALMRPLIGVKGLGGSVARLILIDNSGSMAAPSPSGVSKLTFAERAAEKLIDASRSGDSLSVQLMIPDPTITLPHGFDAAPALLREAIGKVTPTDGAAAAPRAIHLALNTLSTAKAPRRELHILTDLQKDNWSRGEMAADAQVLDCAVMVHRLESTPLTAGSVSIQPIDAPTRSIPAGRITPVHVVLQNHGPAMAHVQLNSADDSGKNISRELDIAAQSSSPVTLTFSFGQPGFHWAQVWVEGDAAPTGNRAELGFWCTDVQKVLFVGDKQDFAAMPYAIAPGGNADLSGIDAVFGGAGQLTANLAEKPLAAVLTWENWPQDDATSEALHAYVHQGGTLFLVPAANAGVAISRPVPAWLDATPGPTHTAAEAEPMILSRDSDPIWDNLRNADGKPKLGLLRAFQYRAVKTDADWQVLVASANGATLLARRSMDAGRIFVSGIAFSPKWTSLPLKAGFVVLMQNAVFGDKAENIPVQPIKAGEEFHFDFPTTQASVKSLAGSALDWDGLARDFEGFPRAGVYSITQQSHASWAAVSGNVEEANPDFLPAAPVPLLHNLPHQVVALTREDDITQTDFSTNSGTPLYGWLLLAALLVLLAETWLANERSSDLGRKLFRSLLPATSGRKIAPKKSKQPASVR
jgi:hypothetical protein